MGPKSKVFVFLFCLVFSFGSLTEVFFLSFYKDDSISIPSKSSQGTSSLDS